MNVNHIYVKEECDADGVPLDWDKCRNCKGTGEVPVLDSGTMPRPAGLPLPTTSCHRCDGCGNLKEAVLWGRVRYSGVYSTSHGYERAEHDGLMIPRCEDCNHSMSDGTWEGEAHPEPYTLEWLQRELLGSAVWELRQGREPRFTSTYYSPCNELCKHDGPGQVLVEDSPNDAWQEFNDIKLPDALTGPGIKMIEAAWRHVDVRFLQYPNMLRQQDLVVLCTRCWAAR